MSNLYIEEFLNQYESNKHTHTAYKRDMQKLLIWSMDNDKNSLEKLNSQDIKQFLIANEHLSPSSIQALIAITGSFYSYLVSNGHISINPVTSLKQKKQFLQTKQTAKEIRKLSDLQLRYALKAVEKLAYEHPDEHARTLFIFNAMFHMYLRISELTATSRHVPKMNDFKKDNLGNWWFTTIGKGNKVRDIVVSDGMISALVNYRATLRLYPLPDARDDTPLIMKQDGSGPIIDTSTIRRNIQEVYDLAEQLLLKDGHVDESISIRKATVHSLRHTGISYDLNVKKRSLIHVRDDAGHSSINTTDKYWTATKNERHASK